MVQPNDTVDSIAQYYQVQVQNIIYINQLVYPYALAIGQALLIPIGNGAGTAWGYNEWVCVSFY